MKDIVQKILAGDVLTVARLIRNVDDGVPGTREILKAVYPHTGRAYVVGITGSPGVGKSTLVDQMIALLRARGKTVGVLAVDPTSPFSGGAVLGDRIRMQRHSADEGVYIRSMATRGQFGGLTLSTRSAVDVLDAMGKDYILVETVGVGQDEVDIVKSAHTTVVAVMPGMGDDIQAIKAGILEAGDIFVINKADRDGADRTESNLRLMLETEEKKYKKRGWIPPVLRTVAVDDLGTDSLLDEIERHGRHIAATGCGLNRRRDRKRVHEELVEMLRHRLMEYVSKSIGQSGAFEDALSAVVNGSLDPYSACDGLVRPLANTLAAYRLPE